MKNDFLKIDEYLFKNDLLDNLLDYQKFILSNDVDILIGKQKDSIIIKNYYHKFEIELKIEELSILFDNKFNNINEAYSFVINFIESNPITDIIIDENSSLILKKLEKGGNFTLITLKNINVNKEFNSQNILNKEKDLKKINNWEYDISRFKLIPFNLTHSSYGSPIIDNSFLTFKSINGIIYLIYANTEKSIIAYNLLDNKLLTEIKNAHNCYIYSFRHYQDKKNKRDLFLSVSLKDNNLKVWSVNDFQCLLNIENIYNYGKLYTACFICDKYNIYIIPGNYKYLFKDNHKKEPLKVFNLDGNIIKEINNSYIPTLFIDCYLDQNSQKNYIIIGSRGGAISYDFEKNKCYNIYEAHDWSDWWHGENDNIYSINIYDKEKVVKLINSYEYGIIGIWNFHSGKLLNKIRILNNRFYGICIWENQYLLIGFNKGIKIIDFKKGMVIGYLNTNDKINTIKKVNHPLYGECFISRSQNDIILWKKQ